MLPVGVFDLCFFPGLLWAHERPWVKAATGAAVRGRVPWELTVDSIFVSGLAQTQRHPARGLVWRTGMTKGDKPPDAGSTDCGSRAWRRRISSWVRRALRKLLRNRRVLMIVIKVAAAIMQLIRFVTWLIRNS